MLLDCSARGMVSVSVDSCLFTPDNAVYSQNYSVYFGSDPSSSNCALPLTSENDTLTFSFTFAEAADCGWVWSRLSDKIAFSGVLAASSNVNKVENVTISASPGELDFQCNFDKEFTLTSGFAGLLPSSPPETTTVENGSLADGFSVAITSSDPSASSFRVGEALTATVSYF